MEGSKIDQKDEAGHFGTDMFNFSKIKGKRYANRPEDDAYRRGWRLVNFRTNGITATLTFVAGSIAAVEATHVSQLIKAGYRIPEPTEKINMDTTRGLFRVQQKNDRNDIGADRVNPRFHKTQVSYVKLKLVTFFYLRKTSS